MCCLRVDECLKLPYLQIVRYVTNNTFVNIIERNGHKKAIPNQMCIKIFCVLKFQKDSILYRIVIMVIDHYEVPVQVKFACCQRLVQKMTWKNIFFVCVLFCRVALSVGFMSS